MLVYNKPVPFMPPCDDEIWTPVRSCDVFPSARMALAQVLREINLSPEDSVALPEYICESACLPVRKVRAKIVFYPIDEQLNPSLEWFAATEKAFRLVLLVNYFGFPASLDVVDIVKKRFNSVVVEDNAHGYFSSDRHDTPLGTRVDFGIFSPRKTLPLDRGGLLWRKNSVSRNVFERPSRFIILKEIMRKRDLVLRRRLASLYAPLRRIKKMIGLNNRRASRDFSVYDNAPSRMPRDGAGLIYAYSTERTRNRFLAAKRNAYDALSGIVRRYGFTPVFTELPDNSCPWVFPFFTEADNANVIVDALKSQAVDAFSWPGDVGRDDDGEANSNGARAAKRNVSLPLPGDLCDGVLKLYLSTIEEILKTSLPA